MPNSIVLLTPTKYPENVDFWFSLVYKRFSDLARQQRQSDMAEIGHHYISLTLLVLAANYVRHVTN